MEENVIPESRYMRYLPSIYHELTKDGKKPFLDRYLLIFERILTGFEENKDEFKVPYLFNAIDFKDLQVLLAKFKNCASPNSEIFDPRSKYIREKFSDKLKNSIDNFDYSAKSAEPLRMPLVDEFNSLISTPFYDEKIFSQVISEDTRALFKPDLQNEDLKHFNRLVLEETYPAEIEKAQIHIKKGIAETLDIISELFHPQFSFLHSGTENIFKDYFSADMDKFLVWLSSWIDLLLKDDWSLEKKREVISKIVPIYKIRGTKSGLEEYLRIYVGADVKITVTEYLEPFQIGSTSTVGTNTVVGDGRPYYFEVYMELPIPDKDLLEKKRKAIIDIIEQEKPAHTYYLLKIQVPTMQIYVHSTVGVDTLLGGRINI